MLRPSPNEPPSMARIVGLALAMVVMADALDQLRRLSKRGRRSFGDWLEGVEQRDERLLRRAELGLLLRRLPSR